jgi:hypothetical protein
MEMEKTLGIPLPGDIEQLFTEESYFGYGTISDYLRFLDGGTFTGLDQIGLCLRHSMQAMTVDLLVLQ